MAAQWFPAEDLGPPVLTILPFRDEIRNDLTPEPEGTTIWDLAADCGVCYRYNHPPEHHTTDAELRCLAQSCLQDSTWEYEHIKEETHLLSSEAQVTGVAHPTAEGCSNWCKSPDSTKGWRGWGSAHMQNSPLWSVWLRTTWGCLEMNTLSCRLSFLSTYSN